jgi:hypothetical protein
MKVGRQCETKLETQTAPRLAAGARHLVKSVLLVTVVLSKLAG